MPPRYYPRSYLARRRASDDATHIRGTTTEERDESREKRRRVRRALYFASLIEDATGDPTEVLRHACAYAQAWGRNSVDKAAVHSLAMVIATAVDERNLR
jgi:hypothetical protein